MLRLLLLALALANAGYFAWTRGWLDGVVGVRAAGDREPDRVERQVLPERLTILPSGPSASAAPSASSSSSPTASPSGGASSSSRSDGAARSSVSATAPTACLEAGPFAERELAAAETALLSAAPVGTWRRVAGDVPGDWLVYIGRFATAEALARKEGELKRGNVAYELTTAPSALEPGFALGRYADRAAAETALQQFQARGVQTARVVSPESLSTSRLLRVDAADSGLAERLAGLRSPALGAGFMACADR